jgi:CHAT domain-containing protein/tetratricopeptide (TPR) repeat protein
MARFCLKLAAKRGSALSLVLLCLAIGSGVAYSQTAGLQTSRSRGTLGPAQRTLAEADRLKAEWKSESLKLAARKYAQARNLFHLVGETRLEIEAYEKLGDVAALLSDYQSAIVHYSRALPLSSHDRDEQMQVVLLTKLGDAYLEMANVKKAFPHCSQALEIAERVGFDEGSALALNCLGVASSITSDVSQAEDQFERALAIAKKIKVPRVLALTDLNLGYLYNNLGNLELALSSYKAALEIWQSINDDQKRASTLAAMAGVYNQQGEKQAAFDLHRQALKLFRNIGHRNGEASALNGIGYLYDTLGDRSESLKSFTRAFELYVAIGNLHYAAVTSGYIGRVRLALGDTDRALASFNRKLEISREVGDRRMESYTLRDIADVLAEKGQTKEALAQNQLALSLSHDVKDRRGAATILLAIGKLAEKSGDKAAALSNYEQALSLMQAVADRRGEVQTLMSLARTKRDLGRLDDARSDIERSLELIEKLRAKVLSPALRISYLETVYRHYEFYVDLLMRMHERNVSGGYATLALEVNEHARARTLLESLIVARTDIRQGVDPQLLEEERVIQQRLNEKAEQQTRLLSSRIQPEREAAIRQEVESLLGQYKEIEARVRDRSPKYAALTQPRPSNLPSIQRELDEDTVLLEYALGTGRSYCWAVTKHSIESFNLPPRAEINRSAKELYDALSKTGAATPADNYPTTASDLSKALLEPVAHLLPGKRLVIVADGILQYIPFTALPEPAGKEGSARVPLVVNHEIVTLPSISTLAVLRDELHGRMVASRTLAVIADPVFDPNDPRVRRNGLHARAQVPRTVAALRGAEIEPPLIHAEPDNRPLIFERLPFSLEEAEAILDLARGEKVMRAVGFDANLKAVLDPAIGQYRIIHFATHALLNNSNPELSGIVLSLVDQSGRSQNGFLRLNEIYNLNLSAELVVLSACQTALGQETRGEGLIGLTRGFMYAGVPRVVATLWRINDRVAAEFMRYFYQAMLKQHESPSQALRAAQIAMWQTNRSAIPHYWAAFTLQGEWR